MKEILTEKVKPDCSIDKKYKILGNLMFGPTYFYCRQHNAFEKTKQFAEIRITNIYLVKTECYKEYRIDFDYLVKIPEFNYEKGLSTSIWDRIPNDKTKLKKKWFGYFDVDEAYFIDKVSTGAMHERDRVMRIYADLKNEAYAKDISNKVEKRIDSKYTELVNCVEANDCTYNAKLDMIDSIELAPIDVELYLSAKDQSKEIKDAYRAYLQSEFTEYLKITERNNRTEAINDFHPRLRVHSIELYEYKVKWIESHTDVFKDSKKFIDGIDTKFLKWSDIDHITSKKSKKKN